MKRILSILLVIALAVLGLTSCELLEKIPGVENILDMLPGGDEHVHEFGEATCTAPKTCECGETEGEPLGHNYVDGTCSCGATDPNYVPPHTHTFIDGMCECGESDPNYVPPHEHNFVDGMCECGESDPNYVPPHEHNFVDGMCECGESDPNYVPPHEHNFVDGVCECGESDPDYVPPHEHNFVDGKCECGEMDTSEPKTYVLDALEDLETMTAGTKADGETEVVGADGFFTVHYSAKTKVDVASSAKTFSDGYYATQRLNMGGGTSIGDTVKNAVEFTTDETATVTIWWVCAGNGREIEIFDAEGNVVYTTEGSEKNGLYLTTIELAEGGTYYLGCSEGSNYYYKIKVTVG